MTRDILDAINNKTIWEIDWAKTERLSFLARLQRRPLRISPSRLIAGIPAHQVWNTDVSGNDRRSVKAYLAGRGDSRVAWWEFNEWLHRLRHRGHSLEHAMVAFHRCHHVLTLLGLHVRHDVRVVTAVILRRGVLAGVRHAVALRFLTNEERIARIGEAS